MSEPEPITWCVNCGEGLVGHICPDCTPDPEMDGGGITVPFEPDACPECGGKCESSVGIECETCAGTGRHISPEPEPKGGTQVECTSIYIAETVQAAKHHNKLLGERVNVMAMKIDALHDEKDRLRSSLKLATELLLECAPQVAGGALKTYEKIQAFFSSERRSKLIGGNRFV